MRTLEFPNTHVGILFLSHGSVFESPQVTLAATGKIAIPSGAYSRLWLEPADERGDPYPLMEAFVKLVCSEQRWTRLLSDIDLIWIGRKYLQQIPAQLLAQIRGVGAKVEPGLFGAMKNLETVDTNLKDRAARELTRDVEILAQLPKLSRVRVQVPPEGYGLMELLNPKRLQELRIGVSGELGAASFDPRLLSTVEQLTLSFASPIEADGDRIQELFKGVRASFTGRSLVLVFGDDRYELHP